MRSITSTRWPIVAFAAIAVAGAAGAVYWWWPETVEPDSPSRLFAQADDDFDVLPIRDPGYVGPQACAACHAARVEGFRATRHFQACVAPPTDHMPAGFAPGKGGYQTRDPALRFEMVRSGDDFSQTTIRTTPAGEQQTSARIALVYGSGGVADEVFHTWHDDGLYELPVVWLHPLSRWGMSSYNPYGKSADVSRETTPRCLECHNTWFEHVPGTRSQYKRSGYVLGVSCESCHGPGRDHVAYHQAHPGAERGSAIVRPDRLARERQIEVCTQCHSNAVNHRGPAFSYRPGEPLDKFYRTIATQVPENDHVANQVQYLRQSKCFQKRDTLTCVTCHNPHRPHEHAAPGTASKACLKCHEPAACTDRERLPVAVRDDCAGCHMPPRVWMNVHFHTEDDQYVPPIRRTQHRIAVDPVAKQDVLLAHYRAQPDGKSKEEAERLTKALVAHWVGEADKRHRSYRFLAEIGAVREALRLEVGPSLRARLKEAVTAQATTDADLVKGFHALDERRFPDAIAALTRAIERKPDLALAHGKLGTAYAATGNRALAVKHLEAAARLDPDEPYGPMMLGWLAYLDDRAEEAVAFYRRADEIEPYNARTHHHWGLALAKLGHHGEAAEHFRTTLTIDPKHVGACQGLADMLRRQGQAAEAVRFALRAARLTDFRNVETLVLLAETCADADRPADARAAMARALETARQTNPAEVPLLRGRLEALREQCKAAPQ